MPDTHQQQPPTLAQSGVVPYRRNAADNELEILLITARYSQHWSLPKGHLEPGMTREESAANEAWEEAGVHGEVGAHVLGTYAYTKRGHAVEVAFFPMLVTKQEETWREQHVRSRRWCSPEKAMVLLETRKMGFLVAALQEWLQTNSA